MIMMSVLLALALQAPAPAVQPKICTIYEGHVGSDAIVTITRRWYTCATGQNDGRVAVDRDWFKAHCHRVDGRRSTNREAAVCDAYADPTARPVHLAAPSKFLDHLKVIGVTAAGVGIVALCTYGGGCGFMGGA